MKAKITKSLIKVNQIQEVCTNDNLYNFPSIKEARKRLQSIKSLCRYPVIEEGKNFFKANRYGEIFIFRIEKQ